MIIWKINPFIKSACRPFRSVEVSHLTAVILNVEPFAAAVPNDHVTTLEIPAATTHFRLSVRIVYLILTTQYELIATFFGRATDCMQQIIAPS
ncbi:hypothetical protein EG68_00932 [Paragonimus skrjabini miyazakii]|uniref:Uncharacterized protein n=1 Tax=Paragonimus skrjabini miyazakii TaxID=59628 RepID=A0A8S9Z307_9TREM|nr:hypothetical protein EG68_00932 [Paragonimus skrjabini miyazakii]